MRLPFSPGLRLAPSVLGLLLGLMVPRLAANVATSPETTHHLGFFHVDGPTVRDEANQPAVLRGVAFGNRVWQDDRIPVLHHDERDFARVADMGMNFVRFYLNYRTFEDDARPGVYLDDGWAWLDQNIEWARRHGVYLLLNFHVPPGGFQSLAKGGDLWEKPELQDRLVALWVAIARRYADEPVVFGYDLVNEPGVTRSVEQWHTLAQRLATAIREVDTNHPIVVERVNSVAGKWTNDENLNFVRVDAPNVLYTFHFYEPFAYTHQFASWMDHTHNTPGGVWPDAEAHRDSKLLRKELEPYLAWARREQVPLYLGEFGCIHYCFEKNRGGEAWAADMLDILHELNLPYTYHVYHEDSFGIFLGDGAVDPTHANQGLIEVFRAKLKSRP